MVVGRVAGCRRRVASPGGRAVGSNSAPQAESRLACRHEYATQQRASRPRDGRVSHAAERSTIASSYATDVQDGKKVYSSTLSSTWDHLRDKRWVHDQDPFNVNQFEHPYQGATMYGLARSSGHRFWTSLIHADVGSFMWKMAGETDPPSINDMITTGQAGSLLGEALYRMSDLVLRDARNAKPNRLHELLADVLSPPSAVNRRVVRRALQEPALRHRSDDVMATEARRNRSTRCARLLGPGILLRRDATAEFWMSYGLPGLPGYDYARPLDYFDFQMSCSVEREQSRRERDDPRIADWAARLPRPANASRHLGAVRQLRLHLTVSCFASRAPRCRSARPASIGSHRASRYRDRCSAASAMVPPARRPSIPSTPTNAAIRDYHFGVTPQALATGRLIASDRMMLDVGAREYYVSGLGSDDIHGSETIFRGNVGLNVRVVGDHAFGVRFVASTRDARYGKLPNKKLSEAAVTFAYSFLGPNRFGAVKW